MRKMQFTRFYACAGLCGGVCVINWQKVTNNLRAKYNPLQRIAGEIGSTENHLNRLARGEVNRPNSFELELKLLDLHYDHCPERHNMKCIGEG